MRPIAVLDAPSNLGLRPPAPGTVPGCYKLAGALRDQGLVSRLRAVDAGYVTPPRYDRGDWQPGDGLFPVVLGGECSILLGPALALARRGRYGVAYLDGHSDFRTVDNDAYVGAAGGEALALVTGRGQPDLTDLEGRSPYVRDDDAVVLGIRDDDAYAADLRTARIPEWTAGAIRAGGAATVAAAAVEHLGSAEGFWVHLDVDILDASVMPAVDSPDPGGLDGAELVALLGPLLAAPGCAGVHIGIFDPDLDPDGRLAGFLADLVVAAFA